MQLRRSAWGGRRVRSFATRQPAPRNECAPGLLRATSLPIYGIGGIAAVFSAASAGAAGFTSAPIGLLGGASFFTSTV